MADDSKAAKMARNAKGAIDRENAIERAAKERDAARTDQPVDSPTEDD